MWKFKAITFGIRLKIYPDTRGGPDALVIIIAHSGHVETIVSLSHKNADSHIHINIEFGEGDGKIPVDKIAQKAELI